MSKNITRSDFAAAINNKVGFSHAEALEIIDQIIQEITCALGKGEMVKISNFATFEPRVKASREGRNPKTKEAFPISERTVISFKPSHALKKVVISS